MTSSSIWELTSTILLSLGGATALLGGLATWIGKLWASRMLDREAFERSKELEQIKAQVTEALERSKAALAAAQARESAELQHRTHVSKTQFDLEFKLYQELWNRIESLRAGSIKYWVPLKEALTSGPLSSAGRSSAAAGQSQVEQLYQSFVEYYQSQSPFISKPVKTWLDENANVLAAINGVSVIALEAALAGDLQKFDLVGKAQLQINAVQSSFAEVIRERIASVAIIS
ncbi:MAG TPA: hypothetical protein VN815_00420 [Steroidobacteraceae bacterium]|nr:hypothetical protein [Steroidobacteraceae bacterium]